MAKRVRLTPLSEDEKFYKLYEKEQEKNQIPAIYPQTLEQAMADGWGSSDDNKQYPIDDNTDYFSQIGNSNFKDTVKNYLLQQEKEKALNNFANTYDNMNYWQFKALEGLDQWKGVTDTAERLYNRFTGKHIVPNDVFEKNEIYRSAEDEIKNKVRQKFAETGESSGLQGIAGDVLSSGIGMIPALTAGTLIGMINPVAGAITTGSLIGGQSAGNYYREALNEGANQNQADLYGLIGGTIEGTLEPVLGIGKPLGILLGEDVSKNAIKGILKGTAKSFAEEGLEEAITDPLVNTAKKLTYDYDMNLAGDNGIIDPKQMARSFLVGGITGGLMGGAMHTANYALNSNNSTYDINEDITPSTVTSNILEYDNMPKVNNYNTSELSNELSNDNLYNINHNVNIEPSTVTSNIQSITPSINIDESSNILSDLPNYQTNNYTLNDKINNYEPLKLKRGDVVSLTNLNNNIKVPNVEYSMPISDEAIYNKISQRLNPITQTETINPNNNIIQTNQEDITNPLIQEQKANQILNEQYKNNIIQNNQQVNAELNNISELYKRIDNFEQKFKNTYNIKTNDDEKLFSIGDINKEDIKQLNNISNVFGLKVIPLKVNPKADIFNGMLDNDIIYINEKSEVPHLNVIGHELIHSLKQNDINLYNELYNSIDEITNKEEKSKLFAELKELFNDKNITDEHINEEYIANIVGQQFTNKSFWDKLYEKSPKLVKNILDTLKRIIVKIKLYADKTYNYERYLKDVEKARDIISETLSKYAESKQNNNSNSKESKLESSLKIKKLKGKKAISRFYTNTLRRTDLLEYNQKALLEAGYILMPDEFHYDIKSEKQSLSEAKARLEEDLQGEIERLKNKESFTGVDFDVAMGILEYYRDEGKETGNYSNMVEWTRLISSKGSIEAGRTVQAHAKYTRTTAGTILAAQKEVEKTEKIIEENNPELMKNIKDETNTLKKILETADKKALDKFIKKLKNYEKKLKESNEEIKPQEDDVLELANRIISKAEKITNGETKEKEIINNIVNELFKKFNTTLPKVEKNINTTDKMKLLARAIENKDISYDTWVKAKDIVKEHFKDNMEAQMLLEKYFGTKPKPPFADNTLSSAITEALKNLNYKLSDIIKNYYATGYKQQQDILNYMVEKSEINENDAELLTKYVKKELKKLKKKYREKYLSIVFGERVLRKKTEKDDIKFIESIVNAGALVNENYINKVNDKLSPRIKALMKQNGFNVKDIINLFNEKQGREKIRFLLKLRNELNISKKDKLIILRMARDTFNEELIKAKEQKLKRMFPDKREPKYKKYYEKILDLIKLDVYNNEDLFNLVKEKEELPILTNEDIKELTELADLAYNKTEEGSYMQKVYLSKIENIIGEKMYVNVGEKIKSYLRMSMLLLPASRVRDILSNTSNAILSTIDRIPLVATDYIVSKALKMERSYTFAPREKANAYFKGLKKGLNEWKQDIKYNVYTSPTNTGYEVSVKKIFNNKILEKLHKLTIRLLQLSDRPFYEAAYQSRITELCKLRKLSKPNEEVLTDAHIYALEQVFQNDSLLSKKFMQLKKSLGIIGDINIPFVQTPANIFDRIIDYTPIGLSRALYELGKLNNNKTAKEIFRGEFRKDVFVKRTARFFTGTSLAILGYVLAKAGLLFGNDDKREKVREFKNELGYKAYSIKIGDKIITLNWLMPVAPILSFGADAFYSGKKSKDFIDSLGKGIVSAGDMLVKQSMLQGFLNILSNFSLVGSIGTSLYNVSSQANPSLLKRIAASIDDYERNTEDDNWINKQIKKLINNIPLLSKTLPPKIDVFGKEVRRYGGYNNLLNTMFNPAGIRDVKLNEVQKEILSLFEKAENNELNNTGISGVNTKDILKSVDIIPDKIDNTITYKGDKIVLPIEDYIKYQKLSGEYLTNMAEQIIKSNNYKQLKDTDKFKILANAIKDSQDKAKLQIIREYTKSNSKK